MVEAFTSSLNNSTTTESFCGTLPVNTNNCSMHLEGVDIDLETSTSAERYLPWKEQASETSESAGKTSPVTSPVSSPPTPALASSKMTQRSVSRRAYSPVQHRPVDDQYHQIPDKDDTENHFAEADNCGLSALPWRCGVSELPSISLMCSEGTCPSLYEPCEPSLSYPEQQARVIPSKFEVVVDDGYISKATNEDHLESAPVEDGNGTDDGAASASLRHLRSRRHEYLSQHHNHVFQQHSHHNIASAPHSSRAASRQHLITSSAAAPRFVLNGENWKAEEETSWRQLEVRVWTWLDQVKPEEVSAETPKTVDSVEVDWTDDTDYSDSELNNLTITSSILPPHFITQL